MTGLGFGPWTEGHLPERESVPVTALVLTKDEEPNIVRCLRSLGWCGQVVVVDSGSTDRTVNLAEKCGADVVQQRWLGFALQREAALRLEVIRHDWVYFVDADEWVSPSLAREVTEALMGPHHAYRQRFRLVFLGRWIEHCGWYGGSWVIRLGRRSAMSFAAAQALGERPDVRGSVGTLCCDIVDEDLKGLIAWLSKHVGYAQVEADRRLQARRSLPDRARRWRRGERGGRSAGRSLAKDVVFPAVPARPMLLFLYMYLFRAGFRDGRAGLVFCALHAWHEMVVGQLVRDRASASPSRPAAGQPPQAAL